MHDDDIAAALERGHDTEDFYTATQGVLDELYDRLEADADHGSITEPVELPLTIDADDWRVDEQGNAYLIDHEEDREYELDVEADGYRQPDAGLLFTQDGDELRLVAGNAEAFSVRGEEDGEWPDGRVPEGMYEAAFEDMAEHSSYDDVEDEFYQLSDAALADRLDPDAETLVVSVTGTDLTPLYDQHVLGDAIAEALDGVEVVDHEDGEVHEVEDGDFYTMEDGTVMLRDPVGRFWTTLEQDKERYVEPELHPVHRHLHDPPELDDEAELRLYPGWVPEKAGEDVADAQTYRHTRTDIGSLLTDINTPWRDIQARRPEGESMSMTHAIELDGEDGPYSEDPGDWMFVNIMSSHFSGPAYPYFIVPNSGDVEQKLDLVDTVAEQLITVSSEADTWQDVTEYLPGRFEVGLEDMRSEDAFFEHVLEEGELTATEVREAEFDDEFRDGAHGRLTLESGGESHELVYGDGGLHGSHTLDDPAVRTDTLDQYRLLRWFEQQGVDVEYERVHTEGYEQLLQQEIDRQLDGAMERLGTAQETDFDRFSGRSLEELQDRYPDRSEGMLIANAIAMRQRSDRAIDHLADVLEDQEGLREQEDVDEETLRTLYDDLDEMEDRMRHSVIGHTDHQGMVQDVIDPAKRAAKRLHELHAGDHPENLLNYDTEEDGPSPRDETEQVQDWFRRTAGQQLDLEA